MLNFMPIVYFEVHLSSNINIILIIRADFESLDQPAHSHTVEHMYINEFNKILTQAVQSHYRRHMSYSHAVGFISFQTNL